MLPALRTMTRNWTHLVRFLAKEDGQVHLGQLDAKRFPDVGLALEKGESVSAKLVAGDVFDGVVTDRSLTISQVRAPPLSMYSPGHRARQTPVDH